MRSQCREHWLSCGSGMVPVGTLHVCVSASCPGVRARASPGNLEVGLGLVLPIRWFSSLGVHLASQWLLLCSQDLADSWERSLGLIASPLCLWVRKGSGKEQRAAAAARTHYPERSSASRCRGCCRATNPDSQYGFYMSVQRSNRTLPPAMGTHSVRGQQAHPGMPVF